MTCHLFLFYATMNHFSIGLWPAVKSGSYTTGNDQLSGWTKKLQSTSQTCTKKRWWSLFGALRPVWPTTAFWILAKLLHLISRLSKSIKGTENCNACNKHWSTERARFFFRTIPNCTSHNECFKSWTKWSTKFCFLCHYLISFQLTTTSSILTTFSMENASTTSRIQKMLFKNSLNPKAHIFMLQE